MCSNQCPHNNKRAFTKELKTMHHHPKVHLELTTPSPVYNQANMRQRNRKRNNTNISIR